MIDLDKILVKTPFKRIQAFDYNSFQSSNGDQVSVSKSRLQFYNVSQDVFMAEIDPNGHRINDPFYYADRVKKADDGKMYIHYVERCSFPIQEVITTKQLTHLAGNNINFVSGEIKPNKATKDLLVEFKQAWLIKNMEVALFESFQMEKRTGDTALCAYIDKNKEFGWRTFGYSNGDTLFPSYDKMTGKLKTFARRYFDGGVENVDYWDESEFSSYVNNDGKWSESIPPRKHGFNRCPIAYKRNEFGPCWSLVQDVIDKYELAISQLCENNKAYAFRIMFISGDDIDIQYDANGSPSAIVSGQDGDAKMIEGADASSSFELQIKTLSNIMFMGSFTVLPPEVKGGDLPGVTIKILYSPAVEKAMSDAKEWNLFVDDVVTIFKEGYGIEVKKIAEYTKLKVRGDIIPYVHQNESEVINNINTSKGMGTISGETAREINPLAKNDENDRVLSEEINDQSVQIKNQTNEARAISKI